VAGAWLLHFICGGSHCLAWVVHLYMIFVVVFYAMFLGKKKEKKKEKTSGQVLG
jgi:cytochrome b subunit of formate dehydrogenase